MNTRSRPSSGAALRLAGKVIAKRRADARDCAIPGAVVVTANSANRLNVRSKRLRMDPVASSDSKTLPVQRGGRQTSVMTPVVRVLLVANLAVFVLQVAFPVVDYFGVFVPQLVLTRPWRVVTVVTYMFLHGGLTHILFNMLGLFFFGPRVEDRMGSRRFTIMYFLSGVSGALLSAVLSPGAALVGASAGVFGVMLCFAHFWPHHP